MTTWKRLMAFALSAAGLMALESSALAQCEAAAVTTPTAFVFASYTPQTPPPTPAGVVQAASGTITIQTPVTGSIAGGTVTSMPAPYMTGGVVQAGYVMPSGTYWAMPAPYYGGGWEGGGCCGAAPVVSSDCCHDHHKRRGLLRRR